MIFPAINLHLWLGFSMAMLNLIGAYLPKKYGSRKCQRNIPSGIKQSPSSMWVNYHISLTWNKATQSSCDFPAPLGPLGALGCLKAVFKDSNCCFWQRKIGYPLVNVYIANWKITMLFMGKFTISMVIFNSYVTNYRRVSKIIKAWF